MGTMHPLVNHRTAALAAPNPGLYRCGGFLMRSERLTWTFLPKYSQLGDVTYWFSFPYGHTLSIETGIYRLLALEPLFCACPMGAWFPLVPGSLTDGISVLLT